MPTVRAIRVKFGAPLSQWAWATSQPSVVHFARVSVVRACYSLSKSSTAMADDAETQRRKKLIKVFFRGVDSCCFAFTAEALAQPDGVRNGTCGNFSLIVPRVIL